MLARQPKLSDPVHGFTPSRKVYRADQRISEFQPLWIHLLAGALAEAFLTSALFDWVLP